MANQTQAPTSVPVGMMAGNAGIPDGALFGLPGVTIWSEQKENNSPTTNAGLTVGAQSAVNFAANFKQTDVVFAWRMLVSIAMGGAPTGTGIALSPYFPWNFLGPIALNMQNQFDTISYFSGYDAALFQMIRPQKQEAFQANFNDISLVANDAYNDAPNLLGSAAYTTSSTSINFDIDLLPGIWFDLYYDLEENGMLLNTKAQGIRTFVTPQMMAGTNRIIQPRVTWNQGGILNTAGNDSTTAPYNVTAGSVTYTSVNGTLNFRRKLTYQPQSSKDAPLLWNWQYSRQTIRNTIGAQNQITIPLPLVGQILSFYVRLVDPGQGGTSQIIPLANISECDVQIGSGLYRYQDTPEDMQSRFYRQHGIRPPQGTLVWDMATMDDGRISNKDAINTLTTSAPQVTITFSVTPSSSAYYVLGYEALRYVALQ